MFEFLKDWDNYQKRKVAKQDANGITVSTCYTSDEGYETALIDEVAVYPVERYKTKEDAEKGHKKWMVKALTATTIKYLGGFKGIIPDSEVELVRPKVDN